MSVNIFSTVITKGVHKVNVLLPKVDLNICVFRCFLFCVVIILPFEGKTLGEVIGCPPTVHLVMSHNHVTGLTILICCSPETKP